MRLPENMGRNSDRTRDDRTESEKARGRAEDTAIPTLIPTCETGKARVESMLHTA